MQHHQRCGNRSDINRDHHRGVFAKAQLKEVSWDDVDQVGYNQRQAGGIGDKSRRHHERQRGLLAEPQRQQHGDNDRRQDQCRTVIGEQRRHGRTQQHDPGKQQPPATVSPASNVQRRPLEKAGLIQQQTDNDYRDKRGRRIPDDIPHHRDIVNVDHAAHQRQRGANGRAPADAEPSGLPDDQHQCE